jgi:hypothetical protein
LSPPVALDLCQAPVAVFLEHGLSIPFHVPQIFTGWYLGRIAISIMRGDVGLTLTTVNRANCLPLAVIIQYILDYVGWDVDANINVLLRLPFLHLLFDVSDDPF